MWSCDQTRDKKWSSSPNELLSISILWWIKEKKIFTVQYFMRNEMKKWAKMLVNKPNTALMRLSMKFIWILSLGKNWLVWFSIPVHRVHRDRLYILMIWLGKVRRKETFNSIKNELSISSLDSSTQCVRYYGKSKMIQLHHDDLSRDFNLSWMDINVTSQWSCEVGNLLIAIFRIICI